jgi:pimeloyl-ACP methyl ester carboxylesterase
MPDDMPRTQPPPLSRHAARERRQNWPWMAAAAMLGGIALATRIAAWRTERRSPPAGRFVTVDGVRLHYVERGAGRALIMLHGMGSLLQDFTSSVVDALAHDYRVVVFDRPGYGYSTRPRRRAWTPQDQARLIHMAATRLGLERPIVLGHSWGALVALAYALAYPYQTAAIVLLGGYLFPLPRRDLAMMGILRVPLLAPLLRATVAPAIARLVMPRLLRSVIFAPNPIPIRFRQEFPLELTYRSSQLRAASEEALMIRSAAAVLSRHYAGLRVPAIILAGVADRVVAPHAQSGRFYRTAPNAAIRLLPRTGHMIHHARPDAVCEAVDIAREEAEAAS